MDFDKRMREEFQKTMTAVDAKHAEFGNDRVIEQCFASDNEIGQAHQEHHDTEGEDDRGGGAVVIVTIPVAMAMIITVVVCLWLTCVQETTKSDECGIASREEQHGHASYTVGEVGEVSRNFVVVGFFVVGLPAVCGAV